MSVQQEVEHFDAYWVSCSVQTMFDLADGAGLGVMVGDEGVEEVGERSEGDLGGFGAVEVAVVDGLAVRRVPQCRLEGLRRRYCNVAGRLLFSTRRCDWDSHARDMPLVVE